MQRTFTVTQENLYRLVWSACATTMERKEMPPSGGIPDTVLDTFVVLGLLTETTEGDTNAKA